MKDLSKLSKKELKKLLKKTSRKANKKDNKKKAKRKHKVATTHNKNMSDRMLEQKPVVARTNAPIPIAQYMPQGFGGSASIDQRNNDMLRGQINDASNKLIATSQSLDTVTKDLKETKKELSQNKKDGYIKSKITSLHKRHKKKKPDFVPLAENRPEIKSVIQDNLNYKSGSLAYAFNKLKNLPSKPNNLSNIKSPSIDRDDVKEPNYFKPNDNIDVTETVPILSDPGVDGYTGIVDEGLYESFERSDMNDEDTRGHAYNENIDNLKVTSLRNKVGKTKKALKGKIPDVKKYNVHKKDDDELRNALYI